MINILEALVDPTRVFASPKEVLLSQVLSNDQKIKILKRWESDLREILVAQEENMQGKDVLDIFEQVREALHALDAIIPTDNCPPTKQGG